VQTAQFNLEQHAKQEAGLPKNEREMKATGSSDGNVERSEIAEGSNLHALKGEIEEKVGRVSKIRVLLADDHKKLLEYVRELLSADGCEVLGTVSDGQAALDAAVKLCPEVTVLDISMPILNGIQAARRLRQADPDAKIVFLTADQHPDTCRAALGTGALGYVLKAHLHKDLIPAIKEAQLNRRFVSQGCEPDCQNDG
jgi:CheY-like chemotaxis protein